MTKSVIFRHNQTGKELPFTAFIEKTHTKTGFINLEKWCEMNCQDLYSYCHFTVSTDGKRFSVTYHFKSLEDAVHFKLVNG